METRLTIHNTPVSPTIYFANAGGDGYTCPLPDHWQRIVTDLHREVDRYVSKDAGFQAWHNAQAGVTHNVRVDFVVEIYRFHRTYP